MNWYILSIIMVITGSLYAFPQVWRSIKRHNAKGLSVYFILFWLLDKLISLAYVAHLGDTALVTKYGIATVFVLIILYFKRND